MCVVIYHEKYVCKLILITTDKMKVLPPKLQLQLQLCFLELLV